MAGDIKNLFSAVSQLSQGVWKLKLISLAPLKYFLFPHCWKVLDLALPWTVPLCLSLLDPDLILVFLFCFLCFRLKAKINEH